MKGTEENEVQILALWTLKTRGKARCCVLLSFAKSFADVRVSAWMHVLHLASALLSNERKYSHPQVY